MPTRPAETSAVRQQTTSSEAETVHAGEEFALQLRMGDIVACYGDLGAGKTRFIQGICRGLGVTEHVTSPTFTILNVYTGGAFPVFHFDFYRIGSTAELRDVGAREYFERGDGLCLIEWPEKASDLLPRSRFEVRMMHGNHPGERIISVSRTGGDAGV